MIPEFNKLADFFEYIKTASPKNADFGIFYVDEEYGQLFDSPEQSYRHHFYAISLYEEMQVELSAGMWKIIPEGPFLYFKTPRQLISWKIKPGNIRGWNIIFTEQFIQRHKTLNSIVTDFTFLQKDKAIPFEINAAAVDELTAAFKKIQQEYDAALPDSFELIAAYLNTLLIQIRRLHQLQNSDTIPAQLEGNAHEQLLAHKFLSMLEQENTEIENCDDCSVTYFAEQLSVHPNYLNAVVKKVTGTTPLHLIQERVLNLSKTLLIQTSMSIKEISYELSFSEPTHFGAFFKKQTGQTPTQFRKASHL